MNDIQTRYIAKPRLKEILSQDKYKNKYRNQKEFALAVGVKDPTISRFDTQTRYDINTLISVSKELEIPVEELFEITENPNYIKVELPKYKELNVDNLADYFARLIQDNKIIIKDVASGEIFFGDSANEIDQEIIVDTIKEFYDNLKNVDVSEDKSIEIRDTLNITDDK